MKRLSAIQGTVLFFFLAPGTVAGVVPWLISGWQFQAPFFGMDALRFLGAALIFAGLDIVIDSFARFAIQGRGTPAPVAPTDRLVVTGLYRHVRNPMYLAVVSMIFGQGLLFGDDRVVVYGALIWIVFHAFVVLYEEPALKRMFGVEFDTFRANVPRWLPRLSPWDRDNQSRDI